MCGQIVLCRGVNDGEELMRSMRDLAALYPAMSSVAIVPAGLTKFRDKLYPLTDFTKDEAGQIIDMINSFGDAHKEKHGTRLFYAADEFYLKADREIPDAEYYEDYPQIENGVGMIRSCSDEFGLALLNAEDLGELLGKKRSLSIVTGVASYPMICEQVDKLRALCPNLNVNIYEIVNNFFGRSITVSGLLTGRDICEQLEGKPLGDELLIPQNCLRHGEDVFLCGMTVSEMSEKLGVPVRATGSDGYELAEAILNESI